MPATAIDPSLRARVETLELRARRAVEGFLSGLHRSPHHGLSIEFAQYRGYVPGDDLRRLDWRVYARTGRLTVKEHETESNLTACLVVDGSSSMQVAGPAASGGMSKLDWACAASAALAHLILEQNDAVCLAVVDDELRGWVEPSSTDRQFTRVCETLGAIAASGRRSDLGATLRLLGSRLRRRSLAIVISDLLDEPERILRGIQHLRQAGREVLLLHVLDPQELDFPFEGPVEFVGLEDGDRLRCHPRDLKRAYLDELRAWLDRLRRGCLANRCAYERVSTATPVDAALAAWLGARARQRTGPHP